MKLLLHAGWQWRHRLKLMCLLFAIFSGSILMAQDDQTISGQIIDVNDEIPLIGVNVMEKGTTNGTVTDIDGNYSLKLLNDDAVLIFSYVGYETKEVAVGSQSVINFSLGSDAELLNEVVVVGYGTLKKTDLTGSVGSLGEEAINERGVTDPMEAIQGNVAGVEVSNSTGRIGDGYSITIRGKNSMNDDSEPLYIVDGVPTDGIDFLNPHEIERIDILKDASSTAIYGSRGSNGVVIVTTKNGKDAPDGVNISFDSYVGTKQVARLPQMMSGDKWWYYHQSAYLATASVDPNTGTVTEETLNAAVIGTRNSKLLERAQNGETYDWYDEVLKDGFQHNSYLSISGRSDDGIGYNLGLGVQNETGNVENESIDKYSINLGVNHRIGEKVSVGVNLTAVNTEQSLGSDLAMQEAFRLNPFLSPYGEDGELFPQPGKLTDENGNFIIDKTSTYNPILEINNSVDEIRRWNGIGNVYLEYRPWSWLTLKTNYAAGYDNRRRGKAWGALTNRGINNNNLPSAELDEFENFNYTWDNQFNINFVKNDVHSFNLLGLQSMYSSTTQTAFASSRNMPFYTGFYNVGSGDPSTYNLGSGYVKQTLLSYALRLNYNYKEKYLLTLSTRWDGSSLLSEGNKWDNFPSVGAAWRISEEDFMSSSRVISSLKLRASYGYTGNNIIDPYSTQNTLDNQTYYDFNGTNAAGWLPSTLANSALTWEKTREVNIGLDFGLFNDRIYGSIDIYDRLSDDLLLQQALPLESGWSTINANVGSVSNKGVEVALTTQNIHSRKVRWETTFIFTKNTNKIEEIYGQDEIDDVGNGFFIGESIDAQYNYLADGIWQADERDRAQLFDQTEGQGRVRDINGDDKITPDEDRIILGSADPDWSGSIVSRLNVGNIDFNVTFLITQGVFVYSPFHANFTDTRDRGRQKLDIADWYIPENEAGIPAQFSNDYPQARNMGTYWRNDGVGYYRDASYAKIKNITLGYTMRNLGSHLRSLRVYANVLNPFVFTDYDGYDPEWADASLAIGRVSSITYQLGVNVNF